MPQVGSIRQFLGFFLSKQVNTLCIQTYGESQEDCCYNMVVPEDKVRNEEKKERNEVRKDQIGTRREENEARKEQKEEQNKKSDDQVGP
jgi:hypothetical protein